IDFVSRQVDRAWDHFCTGGVLSEDAVHDFAFLEKVEKDEMKVTDLFGMLGDLFANGTLGHFEEE
ncbi:hypothetical protein AAVH_30270, partial [Aphelenchoides avenae]